MAECAKGPSLLTQKTAYRARWPLEQALAFSLSCCSLVSCNLVSLNNRALTQAAKNQPQLTVSGHPFYLFVHRNPEAKKLQVSQVTLTNHLDNLVIGIDAFTNQRRYFDLQEAQGNGQIHLPRPTEPAQFEAEGKINPNGLVKNGVFAPGAYYEFTYKETSVDPEDPENSAPQNPEQIGVRGRIRGEGHTPETISLRKSDGMTISVPVKNIVWTSIKLLETSAPNENSPSVLVQSEDIVSEIGQLTMVYTQRIQHEAPYRYPTKGLNGPTRKSYSPEDEDARFAFTINRKHPLTATDIEPDTNYLYIIDRRQEIRIAPEIQPGWTRRLKHGDLTPAKLTENAIAKVTEVYKARNKRNPDNGVLQWLQSQILPNKISEKDLSLFYLMEHQLKPEDFEPTDRGYFRGVAYAGGEARLAQKTAADGTPKPVLLIDANSSYIFARTDRRLLNNWRTLELISRLFNIYKQPELELEISL